MRSFVRNIGTINGEIRNEELSHQTYAIHRSLFTHSELEKQGWEENTIGLLDPEAGRVPFGLWEKSPFFKCYYPLHGRHFQKAQRHI